MDEQIICPNATWTRDPRLHQDGLDSGELDVD